MIRATFDGPAIAAAPGDPARRTVAGTAVPWDVEGTVSDGTRVIFHRGSLDATARPVLLRDHDTTRPLGRVVDAADTGTELVAAARVAATRDGDEALTLAAPPDSVLGMFSVGADPTEFHYDAAGVLHVLRAVWRELSLLTMGAYEAARVATVTATYPTNQQGTAVMLTDTAPDPADVEPDETDPDDVDPDQPTPDTVEAGMGAGGLIAAATLRRRDTPAPAPVRTPPAPVALAAGRPTARRDLTLGGLSTIISAGKRRGLQAGAIRAQITAALTNVTTTDAAGFVRPAYRSEIVGLIDPGMPLVRALQQRPLPSSGMRIEYPKWTNPPDNYAVQAGEKTQIATGPVSVTVVGDDIETWAQGNDISFQLLNRSDPSFIDAYLRAAAVDAGRKYDTAVATKILGGAQPATATGSFVGDVQALFAALDPASVPPGPMFLAVAYDVAVGMIGVTGLDGPAFWSASINLGDFDPSGSAGGLTMFTDWNLAPGVMILGSRLAAASYGGPDTSADVRVVDVSLLGIDIGVYFYAACAVEYPDAFATLTVPPPAPLAARSSDTKSKS